MVIRDVIVINDFCAILTLSRQPSITWNMLCFCRWHWWCFYVVTSGCLSLRSVQCASFMLISFWVPQPLKTSLVSIWKKYFMFTMFFVFFLFLFYFFSISHWHLTKEGMRWIVFTTAFIIRPFLPSNAIQVALF